MWELKEITSVSKYNKSWLSVYSSVIQAMYLSNMREDSLDHIESIVKEIMIEQDIETFKDARMYGFVWMIEKTDEELIVLKDTNPDLVPMFKITKTNTNG